MENLFDNPTTLNDPKLFVGRKDELRRMLGLVKSRQHVSLIGPRRFGKTSLLTCLKNLDLQKELDFDGRHFLFVYLDLQKHSMQQISFLDTLCQALKEQSKSLGYPLNEELPNPYLFEALLDTFQLHEKYPVLLLDAFEEVVRYTAISETVLGYLRAIGAENKVSYIIASMETLPRIVRRLPDYSGTSSPFYNIFATIRLQPLSFQEAKQLLFWTSEKSGLPFRPEEVDWIIEQAGRHPYLLHQVAAQLFEAHRSFGPDEIDYKHIQEEVQQNLSSHFEDALAILSEVDLHSLLEEIKSTLASASNNHRLSSYQPGKLSHNHYSSTICQEFQGSELFYNHLRKTGQLSPLSPALVDSPFSTIDLKSILANLHDTDFLGQSTLIHVPFIAKRIDQQQATTTTLRGQIVQGALREACEKMRGYGERDDADRSWLDYNILYYRYFMPRNMTQRWTAMQLGFSERQYYRFFSDALERFRHELEAIDAADQLKSD